MKKYSRTVGSLEVEGTIGSGFWGNPGRGDKVAVPPEKIPEQNGALEPAAEDALN